MIRLFDIVLSILAVLLILPVLIILSTIVFFDLGSPIIFKQSRLGLNGKEFKIYKFRSMRDASELDKKLETKTVNEFSIKIIDDPRITKFGSFIRKFSLDELPQFFNILKGDMSFVGPRPFVKKEYDAFPKHWSERLSAKPGLTGLAQIKGRSDLPMEQIIENDVYWVHNKSLKLYITVIFKTFLFVLKRKNVY
jgi:lipopolysaccharide/colanic/teichoic acid biosynthesis glycosyltransferase